MSGKFLAGGTTDHQCNPPWPVNQEAHDKIIERQNEQVRARHDKLRAEIKEKMWRPTPEKIEQKLADLTYRDHWDYHRCEQSPRCRVFSEGTLWQCECGHVYEIHNLYWVRVTVSALKSGRGSRPYSNSVSDDAVAGFVLGAVIL